MGNNEDVDGDLDFIKLKIPNFQGKSDPEAYLEWEKRVDWIFLLLYLFGYEEGAIDSHWIYRLRIDLVGSECDW